MEDEDKEFKFNLKNFLEFQFVCLRQPEKGSGKSKKQLISVEKAGRAKTSNEVRLFPFFLCTKITPKKTLIFNLCLVIYLSHSLQTEIIPEQFMVEDSSSRMRTSQRNHHSQESRFDFSISWGMEIIFIIGFPGFWRGRENGDLWISFCCSGSIKKKFN